MEENLQLKYERTHQHTYLVYEGEISEQSYCMQMLLHNSIDGLLQCHIDRIDGRGRLHYEISSKQTMVSIFEKKKMDYAGLHHLFESLKNVFTRMEEFLLPEQFLLLKPDYIYMEPEQQIFYFCLVPDMYMNHDLQGLLEFLLEKIDYADEKAVACAYEWYKRIGEENGSFHVIYNQIFENKTQRIPEKQGSFKPASDGKQCCQSGNEEKIIQEKKQEKTSLYEGKFDSLSPDFEEEWPEGETAGKTDVKMLLLGGAAVGVVFTGAAVYCDVLPAALGGVIGVLLILSVAAVAAYSHIKTTRQEAYDIWEESDEIHGNEMIYHEPKEEPCRMEVVDIPEEEPVKEDRCHMQEEMYGATVFISNEQIKDGRSLKPLNGGFAILSIQLFPYIIGKLTGAVDGIIEHETVSRIHCKIEFEEGQYYIRDLNSTNGTFLNGVLIPAEERTEMRIGDEIQIGQAVYVFE